jgi:hypothetical protein|eukprot:COSAG06_NODE_5_length_38423_cov_121.612645_46_plen_41_part_00
MQLACMHLLEFQWFLMLFADLPGRSCVACAHLPSKLLQSQ